MENIDYRRAVMARLAEKVREILSLPPSPGGYLALSPDQQQCVLELAEHVTAIDSALANGESTFPVLWMNDGTLGHDTFRERVASALKGVVENGWDMRPDHEELLKALIAEAKCPTPLGRSS